MKALRHLAVTLALCLAGAWASRAGDLLEVNGSLLKWLPAKNGALTTITYAIVTAPYALPDKSRALSPDNCAAMQAFDGILASSPGITAEHARRELRAAFDAWEAVSNIVFTETGNPLSANIVVGGQAFPAGRAFTNLAYRSGHALLPVEKALGAPARPGGQDDAGFDGSVTGIEQSYICLNPGMRWKTGFDGDLNIYDLRHTFMHEIGHAIGLDHPGASDAIMAFRYDERVRVLQPSDIAAVQSLYGPPSRGQ